MQLVVLVPRSKASESSSLTVARRIMLGLAMTLATGCDSCRHEPRDPSVTAALAVDAGSRTPAEIRSQGNHLKGAGSLYLRMHAANPVDWYPWGPEALARAKALDRPIFLSIGYASCHWCHVMEEEVFSRDDVAAYLNLHFVSIKVDREERPDLDALYIDAVQTMTGTGGWPLTVFLTPAKKPFFGGTYYPHDAFVTLTSRVVDQFARSRGELETRAGDVYAQIAKAPEPSSSGPVRSEEVVAIAQQLAEQVDPTWGGFRGRMKFPNPVRWTLLLDACRKGGDASLATAVKRTLDSMASGGIHDHIGGGFHRYTVDTEWVVPHFEKMLYVNAELAALYLEAAAAFGERRYVDVATGTLDFLLRDMATANGGFAASLDADSGGHEGTFYVFSPADLRKVAGDADGAALAAFLGASDAGNFEGKNVLTRRSARAADLAPVFHKWRQKLLDARLTRAPPARDTKVVTSWNGMAISAFAGGFAATGDGRYREAATKAADLLWTVHRPNGALLRVSNEGHAEGAAVLDDYAAFAGGLIDVFQITGDPRAIERALALVDEVTSNLASDRGGWYAASASSGEPPRIDLFDSEEPSGYAAMLRAISRLAALTGRPSLYSTLDKAFAAYAESARSAKLGMVGWLDAALRDAGPFYDVVVAGAPDDPRTRALIAAYRALAAPWTVIASVPVSGPSAEAERLMPALAGKTGDATGKPRAYVCIRGACKLPTADPSALRAQLLAGWSK